MKLTLKNSDNFLDRRFSFYKQEKPCLDTAWHYHPEFELIYIPNSSGLRFVGDNVAPFSPGELVLVGAYLPHLWRNDATYFKEKSNKKVETIVLKFKENFIGEGTFDLPEFSQIKQLLVQSRYGIYFEKEVSEKMHADLIKIVDLPLVQQAIRLLDLLCHLSLTSNKKILSSTDMRQNGTEYDHRLDQVLKYISDHYAESITLNDVANITCMTTNSFCRFFKKKLNKSFTEFLNEVRIRNASRLLAQKNLQISDVCYMVGYNSITNFNKRFKQIMGNTPKSYRQSISTTLMG